MIHSSRPDETPTSNQELQVALTPSRLSALCISFRCAFQTLGAMTIPADGASTKQELTAKQNCGTEAKSQSILSRALSATADLCKSIYDKAVDVATDVVTAVLAVDAEEQNNQKQSADTGPSTAQRIFESIPSAINNQPSLYFSQTEQDNKKDKEETATNAPARDGSRFLLSLVGKAYQFGVITFVSPYYLLESVKNGKIHPMLLEKLNLDVLTRSAESETLSTKPASIDKEQ